MLIGIDVNETFDFVPESEKGSDSPTVFVIGTITNAEKQRLFRDTFSASGETDFAKLFDKTSEIVKVALKGIKNISVKGEVKDVTVIDDAAIELVPYSMLLEVYKAIMEFNQISKAEEKN